MSTLDVDTRALRSAVARFPIVGTVTARASFPHGLRIAVVERKPIAELGDGTSSTALSADGVVLGPQALAHGLPAVTTSFEPPPGRRLTDPKLLGPLAILAAAPRPVLHLIVRAFDGPHGITLAMRNGLDVYFGDSSLPHAKWLALGRVLADPSSSGALYIDLSVPSHPAAGFAGPVARGSEGEAGGEGHPAGGTSTEDTVAALASQLSAHAPGAQSSGPSGSSESSAKGTSGSSESSSTGSEASSESESESGAEASQPTG
jgi:cell division septal protein FtsQ